MPGILVPQACACGMHLYEDAYVRVRCIGQQHQISKQEDSLPQYEVYSSQQQCTAPYTAVV